jgi:hypothetical protein
LTRGLVDHPGLFKVRLDQPKAMTTAAKTLVPLTHERHGRARAGPTLQRKSGLHRYCSGCTHETEHVAWSGDGQASIPTIRWPAAEPAGGVTICVDCGQWRAAAFQASAPAWSSWPRTPIARRSRAIAPDSDDGLSETAAENEGMPPRLEPSRRHQLRRARRTLRPAAVR